MIRKKCAFNSCHDGWTFLHREILSKNLDIQITESRGVFVFCKMKILLHVCFLSFQHMFYILCFIKRKTLSSVSTSFLWDSHSRQKDGPVILILIVLLKPQSLMLKGLITYIIYDTGDPYLFEVLKFPYLVK